MEVIKKRIARKDVAKVMKEVGYNKKSLDSKSGSNIEDQLAVANENAKSAPTMADAINKAVKSVTPVDGVQLSSQSVIDNTPIVLPKTTSASKVEPKSVKSEPVEKSKEEHKEPEKPKGPKKVTIDMTTPRTKVTFVGIGWTILNIKIANHELIKALKIKIRDEYRKGKSK